jgi:hypothetical protein
VLGWYSRLGFDRTLDITAKRYKRVYYSAEAEKITRQQLYDYFLEIDR